jgi:hypothetical protein
MGLLDVSSERPCARSEWASRTITHKEVVQEYDHRNNKQDVNKTPSYVEHQSKRPEDEENNENGPQNTKHCFAPFNSTKIIFEQHF